MPIDAKRTKLRMRSSQFHRPSRFPALFSCLCSQTESRFIFFTILRRSVRLFDQGGEGRSEHTKGFCPPVCRALRCPSMEPGHRFAPRLRRADYSTLLGVVSLLVCSPACLPAAPKVLLRALMNAAGWPNAPGDGSTIQFPSPL